MFTGIIKTTGEIVDVRRTRQGCFFTVKPTVGFLHKVRKGESVSMDGVCLTNIVSSSRTLQFELINSTLRRTTLGMLRAGDRVNIEPAMRIGEPVGGHFMSGHVDGVGVIKNLPAGQAGVKCKIKNGAQLEIKIADWLARYIVPQGSIAVNGVSLTVVEAGNDWFSVALTRYTLTHTNLGGLKKGDQVNLEVDTLAKYVDKFVKYALRNHRRKI